MGTYANFYNSDNGDRIYDAEAFAEWLKPFFKTGVFNNELQVVASSGMNVVVKSGNAYIEGKLKKFDNETVLALEPASSTVDRIDAIVVRRNDTERDFTIQVIKGSTNAPQPVREGGIYDIVLAHISVPMATTEVTQALITDTRMNANICGWVVSNIEEVDFNQITAQFSDYLAQFEADNLQEFADWFNLIKGQLTTDQAGALWTAIEGVNASIDQINTDVKALQTKTRINYLRPTLQTTTQNGVTCTNNGDGTFTLNGTATQNTFFPICEINTNNLWYKMVGCPSGGDYDKKYAIYFDKDGNANTKIIDQGDGVTFEANGKQKIFIKIVANSSLNNLVFKPMLTDDLSATYDDFISYDDSFVKKNEFDSKVEELNTAIANSGKFYGIDTKNIIASGLGNDSTMPDDGWLCWKHTWNGNGRLVVDGVWVDTGVGTQPSIVPIKKGQVAYACRDTDGAKSGMSATLFGLKE